MSGRSVNLTTLFLGRRRPPKRLTVHILSPVTDNCPSWKSERRNESMLPTGYRTQDPWLTTRLPCFSCVLQTQFSSWNKICRDHGGQAIVKGIMLAAIYHIVRFRLLILPYILAFYFIPSSEFNACLKQIKVVLWQCLVDLGLTALWDSI